MIRTVVIGSPIDHSLSPKIHNEAFINQRIDGEMKPILVEPADLKACLRKLRNQGVVGASVTIPHKVEIIKYCDALSKDAQAIGAVNCLEFKSNKMIGHNTDAAGYIFGLKKHSIPTHDQHIHIYGGGGAAKALHHKLKRHNDVEIFARNPKASTWCKANHWNNQWDECLIKKCTLLIDCTPIGLSDTSESQTTSTFPLDLLMPKCVISTLIYHRETALLKEAKSKHHKVIDGLDMLVGQARHAFKIWTGAQFEYDLIIKNLRQ